MNFDDLPSPAQVLKPDQYYDAIYRAPLKLLSVSRAIRGMLIYFTVLVTLSLILAACNAIGVFGH